MTDGSDEPLYLDRVEIPFIWIPDDYNGPRPGYPWFEAGRMTLSAKQLAAWPRSWLTPWGAEAYSSNDAGSVQQYAGEVSDGSRPSGPAPADRPGPAAADGGHAVSAAAEARLAGYTYPNTGAAMRAWNALSDPRATLAALDAVSGSNPVVTSLAQERVNLAAGPPIQQEPLPPLPSPPPLPPTMSDTDLERGGLLPWRQPGFFPGTNDRIYIPPDTEPPGPIDPSMSKEPPGDDVTPERPFRDASAALPPDNDAC